MDEFKKIEINNYLEQITVYYKNMTEIEMKQIAYYVLRSNEWKGIDRLSVDEDLETIMAVKMEKNCSSYFFDVTYQIGIAEKTLMTKTVRGRCFARIANKLTYFMRIDEERFGNKVRDDELVIEEYSTLNGNLIRTTVDNGVRKPENLDENIESLKYSILDFDNIALSYSKPKDQQKLLKNNN